MKKLLSMVLAIILVAMPVVQAVPVAMTGVETIGNDSDVTDAELFAYTDYSKFNSNYTLTGDVAIDIANIAYAQVGKTGPDLGYSGAWCAKFTSDCARIAGISSTVIKDATLAYPSYFGLSDSQIVAKENIKNGDLCFWSDGHVGIVYNGKVVSGNNQSSGETVSKVKYYDDKYANAGTATYYRPNYKLDSDTIMSFMKNTYQQALTKYGYSSFSGYCGDCVGFQLWTLGVNTTRHTPNGNNTYDYYAGLTKTEGGYAVTKYPASLYTLKQALTDISAKNTAGGYTYTVVGFTKGSSSDGGQKYGHTLLIYAIIDNYVYYSECFTIGSTGTTFARRTIDSFCSAYSDNSSTSTKEYVFEGLVWLTKDDIQTNFSAISAGEYYLKNGDYYLDYVVQTTKKNTLTGSTSSKAEFEIVKDREFYKITSTTSTNGTIVNVNATNSSNGNSVILWTDTTNPSQRWYFEECGDGYLIHPADNVSLSLTRNTSTNEIYVNTTTKADNQIWTLESANQYTVHLSTQGGGISTTDITVTYGATYGDIPTPSKPGYTFDGWYTALSGGTKVTSSTVVTNTSSHTLYARWLPNMYGFDLCGLLDGANSESINEYGTVDVYINGTCVADDVSDFYGEYPNGTTWEIKDICTLRGKVSHIDSNALSGSITSNTTVRLEFNSYYSIYYNENFSTNTPEEQFKFYDEDLILSSLVPIREGYIFKGWVDYSGWQDYSEENMQPTIYSPGETYTLNQSLNLVPIWESNGHYDINLVEHIPEMLNTTRSHYPASGNFGLEVDENSEISDAAIYFPYLRFNANDYRYVVIEATVEIFSDNLEGMQVFFITEEDSVFDENKSIWYWFINGESGNKCRFVFDMSTIEAWEGKIKCLRIDPFNGTGKIHFDSVYLTKEETVKITYDANGGTNAPSEQIKAYGDTVALSEQIPTRNGYTFLGWSTSATGSVEYVAGATYSENSDVTLYAVWQLDTVSVTGVTLNKTSATLEIGDTETLTATVNPTNATNKNVTWTSSNNSVATVSNGLVTAVGEGVADITVTTEDGDKTAVCTVTVNKVPPLDAKAIFTIDNVSARPGDTVKVKIYLSTEEAINTIGLSGFTYDSGVLTFVGFCDHEELDNKAILKSYDNEKCILTVALNETKKYDGYLCSLEFKVNDNAAEGKNVISAQSIVKNTGLTVVSDVVSGGITVRHQMLGDLDGNESVDIDDAVLLLQYSLFPDAYPIDYTGNIDFDKNDSIDIDDAVLLLQYSLFPDAYPLE